VVAKQNPQLLHSNPLLPSNPSVPSLSLSSRWLRPRTGTALKAQVEEEESAVVTPENGLATGVGALEELVSAPIESQSSWLPSFPHVLTAAMANFMFGYHIGVMNGPLESIARELKFEGDTIMEGFVVSIFIVGAFLGSVGGGVLADSLGRRRTFQVDAIPLVLGAALSATAQSSLVMILGRFLVGIGIGVNTGLVPMYISEVAPTKFRGALGSLCQIGTCVGIIAALLIGIPAETDPHWWRTMLWLATIPGVALIVGMQFAAESPRWLGKMGRWDEAENLIEKLWGKGEVAVAMEELRAANSSEGEAEDITWSELVQAPYFKVAAIGSALFALQQFAGINGVLYFSSLTFKDAGITNGILASAAVGVANLVGALVALSLMDNQGRRKLLMGSYGGMAVAMALLVAALGMPDNPDLAHSLSVGGTLLYVFTFALGAGPVTALIIPELCTTRLRSKTMAVSLCTHWVCNFGIGLFFLDLVQRIGLQAVYTSFGVTSLLAIAFANSYIIETKGRSLEEIEMLMNGSTPK
jgi:sugar porter (SP) family MFS transporter